MHLSLDSSASISDERSHSHPPPKASLSPPFLMEQAVAPLSQSPSLSSGGALVDAGPMVYPKREGERAGTLIDSCLPVFSVHQTVKGGGPQQAGEAGAGDRQIPYEETGKCKYGNSCTFAHSAIEILPRPDFERTKLCCRSKCKKVDCPYAHSVLELRAPLPLAHPLLIPESSMGAMRMLPAATTPLGSDTWSATLGLVGSFPAGPGPAITKANTDPVILCHEFFLLSYCPRGSSCPFSHGSTLQEEEKPLVREDCSSFLDLLNKAYLPNMETTEVLQTGLLSRSEEQEDTSDMHLRLVSPSTSTSTQCSSLFPREARLQENLGPSGPEVCASHLSRSLSKEETQSSPLGRDLEAPCDRLSSSVQKTEGGEAAVNRLLEMLCQALQPLEEVEERFFAQSTNRPVSL